MPALPLDEAGKYVAAAYLVFLTLLIVYVAIMGMKIARIEREIGELLELEEAKNSEEAGRSPAVKPSQDGEQSTQTAGQDGPSEVIHSGGPGQPSVRRSNP